MSVFQAADTMILVPARAGSKGLPGKNTKPFAGHPLVLWSLAAAQYLQQNHWPHAHIVCSSDDAVVAQCVQQHFPEVLFRQRPAILATDTVGMADVVLDAVQFLSQQHNRAVTRYCLLQPTSPLRLLADLDVLARAAAVHGTVVSCTAPTEAVEDLVLPPTAQPVWHAPKQVRRQDRADRFGFVDGSFYSGQVQTLHETRSFMPEGTWVQMLSMARAADIDLPIDWHMALALRDWLEQEGHGFVTP